MLLMFINITSQPINNLRKPKPKLAKHE